VLAVRARQVSDHCDGVSASASYRGYLGGSWCRGPCACKVREGEEDEGDGTRACSGASRTCPCALTAWPGMFWACRGVRVLASVVLSFAQGWYWRV
jgi:hypothetical protein